ncbi:MAG: ribonuclease P protein component [Succinivibrionaceae bacterium]
MTKENFKREYRLYTPQHFDNVFNNPCRLSTKGLTVLIKKNDLNGARIGLIVSKKQFKKAVWRTKIKRLIRESFRKNRNSLNSYDIVVIAKYDLLKLANNEIFYLIENLWKKISIYSKN